jgi:hypothetical protein
MDGKVPGNNRERLITILGMVGDESSVPLKPAEVAISRLTVAVIQVVTVDELDLSPNEGNASHPVATPAAMGSDRHRRSMIPTPPHGRDEASVPSRSTPNTAHMVRRQPPTPVFSRAMGSNGQTCEGRPARTPRQPSSVG